MAAPCVGVLGTFQYIAPQCTKQQQADTTTSDAGHPAVTKDPAEEDPQARCEEKGGKPDELEDICPKCNDEVVWVRRRIDIIDPRFEAPAPRYKIVARDPDTVCVDRRKYAAAVDPCSLPTPPTPKCWTREAEKAIFVSQHHTRCEQWSTLREMLPSRGRAEPQKQPNWGTGRGVAPSLVGTRASRFPVYDSEMTRFVKVAHAVDPQFHLF